MNRFFYIFALLISAITGFAATPTLPNAGTKSVSVDTSGNLNAPSDFFNRHVLPGSGVTFLTNGNKITISSTGGGGGGGGGVTINSQSGSSQTLTAGTSGTDFAVSSSANVHTFNLPNASSTARGALTSGDWVTFNNKVATGRQILAGTGLAGGGSLAGDVTLTLAPTSSSIASALGDETGTGSVVFNSSPTISTPTINGVVAWQSGTRQTFAPNSSSSGVNIGSVSVDPSGLSNGDLWVNSTSGRIRTRVAGASADIATGGQYDINVTTLIYVLNMIIDLNAAQYQTVSLTGNTTLTTTSRPSAGSRSATVFFAASGGTRTVNCNASWKNYGASSTITIPSGKEAFLTITALGPNETDIRCNWGLQP